jgi:hypothetical protein
MALGLYGCLGDEDGSCGSTSDLPAAAGIGVRKPGPLKVADKRRTPDSYLNGTLDEENVRLDMLESIRCRTEVFPQEAIWTHLHT